MPKLTCACGEVINLSPVPNPQGFNVFSEAVHEKIIDSLVAAHQEAQSQADFEQRAMEILTHVGTPGIMQMYECPHCGRLAVFGRAWDSTVALWFQLERAVDPGKAHSLSTLSDYVTSQSEAEEAKP